MPKEKKIIKEEIRITELQRLYDSVGWYEAVIKNRLREGYVFYKDPTNGDYVLTKTSKNG